jgi:hypothetical protein
MAELIGAIEGNRAPLNRPRENLRSLALAQAAIRSAESGQVAIITHDPV